jgi:hypothetical protein
MAIDKPLIVNRIYAVQSLPVRGNDAYVSFFHGFPLNTENTNMCHVSAKRFTLRPIPRRSARFAQFTVNKALRVCFSPCSDGNKPARFFCSTAIE